MILDVLPVMRLGAGRGGRLIAVAVDLMVDAISERKVRSDPWDLPVDDPLDSPANLPSFAPVRSQASLPSQRKAVQTVQGGASLLHCLLMA